MTDPATPFVRMAEIDVDPDRREAFILAVTKEMTESVRVEPGVLAIHAVADRDDPARLRFFEIYESEAAYEAHLASSHFRAYLRTTEPMIRSRTLIDVVPVRLSSKAGW
jgi:quinol monooxygenase YgiN